MSVVLAIFLTWLTIQKNHLLSVSNNASPTPTPFILETTLPLRVAPLLPTPYPDDTSGWGELIKTGEHTYQIRVKNDPQMGSSTQILQAINDLRARNGAQPLKQDPKLCAYTQTRADSFKKAGNIDEHAGFEDFLDNHDGFTQLGYAQLGENSSFGYIMSGVHLIEFVYMRSPEHNKNQLDPKWDHGCVGVAGSATNIIFATSPL